MRPTHRAWLVSGLGAVLIAVAVLTDRFLPLLGAGGLAAWLLTGQYMATRSFRATDDQVAITLTPAHTQVATDRETLITLRVERTRPTTTTLDVTAPLPVGAHSEVEPADRTVTLDSGEQSAETTFPLTFPVAGEYTLPQPTVTFTDEHGLVTEELLRGDPPSIVVEPPRPHNVHVGQAGEEIVAAFGEYDAGRRGAGLTPEEIRQYVPGDATARIDWKATARLNELHVREFEAETDRQTVIMVDHRAAMNVGPPGETMLDYAREIALGVTWTIDATDGPLGLYTVGDAGLTTEQTPATAPEQYTAIRATLHSLSPTETTSDSTADEHLARPAAARHLRERLAEEESAFARTLTPFFEATEPYVQRFEQDALFGAVERELTQLGGSVWTVLLTDDSQPNRVREAVRLATQQDNYVIVLLLPEVLFEPGGLGDLATAYERYAEFEEFRQELDRLPRVSAFEVGPGDRIEAILTARRQAEQTYE